jgi:hypothetical protein
MITLIALAVLMMLVGGAIQFTNYNREATAEKLRGDRVSACADAARRHMLSRLKLFRASGDFKLLSTKLIDSPEPAERSKLTTGHYGEKDPMPTVVAVDPVLMGAATRQVRDISNAAPSGGGTLGGQYFSVVVKCQEYSGRESEVEFLFRYGL